MRLLKRYFLYIVLVLLLIYPLYRTVRSSSQSMPAFALLIPESSAHLVSTQVWLHAALEEGLPIQPLLYEEVINSFQKNEITSKVIIVPDEVARYAPALLLSILQNYVMKGGKLAIVSDALTQEQNGTLLESFPIETYFHFPKIQGRVGDHLQFSNSSVQANKEWIDSLQVPPGRYAPPDWAKDEASLNSTTSQPAIMRDFCTYQSMDTPYPHWLTLPASEFKGTTLLQGKDGSLVAGLKKLGKGEVVWINMPLSYLKKRTDGLFLHSFLRWISEDWAGLPKLLGVPDGIGGMILNVHVDSNASLPGLQIMKSLNMFSQGPFSVHVTAGPDAHSIGDKLGFNLPENKTSQEWVKYWVAQGHEVGAHGGWVHDYFGKNLTEKRDPEFEKLLELNQYWVGKISGKPVLEYSSPVGNHPVWVNQWIKDHGYNSYYFAGNTGLAPTRTFRDEVFTDENLWSFPVASFQQVASFEEASEQNIPQKEMQEWLLSLSQFVSRNQTARLFYFHPPGVRFYKEPLQAWMKLNQKFSDEGKFKWYTMNQLSKFLDQKEKVQWSVSPGESPGAMKVTIKGTEGISKMVWRFPKKKIKSLNLVTGEGAIRESKDFFEFQPKKVSDTLLQYQEAE